MWLIYVKFQKKSINLKIIIMKKNLLLFVCSLFSVVAMAQPTITTAELPIAGLAWTTANDTNYFTNVLPGGANVTWDYSGLQNQYLDTVGFQVAAGTPYAATFPTSNLAAFDPASGGWSYITSDATGFYFNGFTEPTIGLIQLNPPQLVAPVPFTFGDIRTSTSGFTIDTLFNGQYLRFEVTVQSEFEADGYGTVLLPTGTFNNVLRVKSTDLSTNVVSIGTNILGTIVYAPISTSQSQSTTFSHYQQGASASFILDIDADSLGSITNSSSYLLQSVILSAPEIDNGRTTGVFPNPAADAIIIQGAGNEQSMTVYGLDGKNVVISLVPQGRDARADVSQLANGLYFFTVGKRAGKFTVQH